MQMGRLISARKTQRKMRTKQQRHERHPRRGRTYARCDYHHLHQVGLANDRALSPRKSLRSRTRSSSSCSNSKRTQGHEGDLRTVMAAPTAPEVPNVAHARGARVAVHATDRERRVHPRRRPTCATPLPKRQPWPSSFGRHPRPSTCPHTLSSSRSAELLDDPSRARRGMVDRSSLCLNGCTTPCHRRADRVQVATWLVLLWRLRSKFEVSNSARADERCEAEG